MEDKRRESKRARQDSFAQLLIESCTIKPIPGFNCAYLEEHPIGLVVPDDPDIKSCKPEVYFVGEGETEVSVRGLTRLVAWEIAGQCLGDHRPVNFLRMTHAQAEDFPRGKADYYYEVGLGRRVYMTGGCNNIGGEGSRGAREIADLLLFLSQTYGVPVNNYYATPEECHYLKHEFHKLLWQQYEECKESWTERLAEWEKWPQFYPGHVAKLTDEGWHSVVGGSYDDKLKEEARQPLLVLDVETVPNYCSCGLGNAKTFPVILHPERKCHLRRRFEMKHNQIVTMKLGSYERKITGYYLEHV